jgi:hypothetical protein
MIPMSPQAVPGLRDYFMAKKDGKAIIVVKRKKG